MSPSFSSSSGPLSPQLSTGDSIRDKCIELLAAALRTNGEDVVRLPHWQLNKTAAAVLTQSHTHTHTTCTNKFLHVLRSGSDLGDSCFVSYFADDYKEFGANCDSMAAEIEDHILWFTSVFLLLQLVWFDLQFIQWWLMLTVHSHVFCVRVCILYEPVWRMLLKFKMEIFIFIFNDWCIPVFH